MSKFTLDINKFIKKVEGRTEAAISYLVLELFNSVVRKSPVDTGRFRNSWFITGNPTEVKQAQDALEQVSPGSIAKMAEGGAVYIINNMPYAMKLEFGSSKQAPHGVARLTVMEFQRYLDKAVTKAKADYP